MGTATLAYDAANRLQDRWFFGTTSTQDAGVHYVYRANGQVQQVTRNHGGDSGKTSFLYDVVNRMTQIHYYDGSNASLATLAYTYNAGNLLKTEKLDSDPTVTYTYDDVNELTADGAATIAFDNNGNRDYNLIGSYDEANELLDNGLFTYTYDLAGNLQKKVDQPSDPSEPTDGEAWVYKYDHRNQLTRAEHYDEDPELESTETLLEVVEYGYDRFGGLVERRFDEDADEDWDEINRFVRDYWAGSGSADVLADLDDENDLVTRYMRDDGGELLARNLGDDDGFANDTQWVLNDRNGSIRFVTDEVGDIDDEGIYTGWDWDRQTEHLDGWYSFRGRMDDPVTGLSMERGGGWIDPLTQRMVNADKGDTIFNRYIAAGNNPQDDSGASVRFANSPGGSGIGSGVQGAMVGGFQRLHAASLGATDPSETINLATWLQQSKGDQIDFQRGEHISGEHKGIKIRYELLNFKKLDGTSRGDDVLDMLANVREALDRFDYDYQKIYKTGKIPFFNAIFETNVARWFTPGGKLPPGKTIASTAKDVHDAFLKLKNKMDTTFIQVDNDPNPNKTVIAYTTGGTIHLTPLYFKGSKIDQFSTLIHELAHAFLGADDHGYAVSDIFDQMQPVKYQKTTYSPDGTKVIKREEVALDYTKLFNNADTFAGFLTQYYGPSPGK